MKNLPSGWSWEDLSNVVEILDNLRVPIKKEERENRISGKDSSKLYPYYGATGQVGLIDDYIFDEELVLLGEDGVPFLDKFKSKAYIARGKFWVNNHAHVLRPNKEIILSSYLCYFLNTVNFHNFVSGTTRLKLTKGSMENIQIAVPPLEIQKRIIDLLEKSDRLITNRKNSKEIVNALTQSIFLEIFGDPYKNSFDWNLTQIENVSEIVGGGTPSTKIPEYWDGKIFWLTPSDVTSNSSLFIDQSSKTISELGLKNSSARMIPANSVLLTSRASIGNVIINTHAMSTNQGFINIIPKENHLLSEFLAYWLILKKDYLISLAPGTTFRELSKSNFKKIMVPCPPLNLQRKFKDIINKISVIHQKMNILYYEKNNLFRSLLETVFIRY